MNARDREEMELEIEVAELMAKDLEKIWKSCAKKAQDAKLEREKRQEKKGFMDCETVAELQDAYGYDAIDEETYYRGLDYFENLKKPPVLSVVEAYRRELREKANGYKSTANMLREELDPTPKAYVENAFERLEREEREGKLKYMQEQEALSGLRRG